MKDLWAILKYEAKQSLYKPIVIVLMLILAAGLAFIQLHTIEYKDLHAQKAIFQAVEKTVIESYATYRHYATYGFRVMFLPAPISILFANSSVLQDMTANIETGFRLNIYQSLKSKIIFGIYKYLFSDFSGIFLFFVGLIAVFYGLPAFRSQEYLKTLASISDKKNLFRNILLARAILLAIYNLLFLVLAVLLISLNGVSIGIDQYLVFFFLEMCCVTTFFLVLGAAFGSLKSKKWVHGVIIAVWLISLFIIPFLVDLIVSVNAATIKPETQLEIEKLKLMMDFEKNAKDKKVTLDMNQQAEDIQKQYIMGYYKNEFQKIQALEDQLKVQMHNCKKMHYWLSSFFPTTFYQSLTNELSSKGYETLEAFYNTVKQIKENFFKEYIKQVYFLPQPTKAEPFLKGDDNIIVGKPALPGYLLLGFCFNLIWIVAFALIAYSSFKKALFELPEMEAVPVPSTCHVRIKKEVLNSWYVNEDYLNNYLYNLLSGESLKLKNKPYPFIATLNGQPWDAAAGRQNFLYLCHPKEIPGDIIVGNFLELEMNLADIPKAKQEAILDRFSLKTLLKKRFGRLNRDEMGQFMLALLEMKPYDFYLINNIARKMYWEFSCALVEKMHALSEAGAAVLFLTDEYISMDRSIRTRVYFHESYTWIKNVTDLKNIDLNQELEREQGVPNSGYQE